MKERATNAGSDLPKTKVSVGHMGRRQGKLKSASHAVLVGGALMHPVRVRRSQRQHVTVRATATRQIARFVLTFHHESGSINDAIFAKKQ